MLACIGRSRTTFGFTPLINNNVAHVRRRLCRLIISGNSAVFKMDLRCRRKIFLLYNGNPSAVQNTRLNDCHLSPIFKRCSACLRLCSRSSLLFVEEIWMLLLRLVFVSIKRNSHPGVAISAITSLIGNGSMIGNRFLWSLALSYWLVAGAIIALSYEEQKVSEYGARTIL